MKDATNCMSSSGLQTAGDAMERADVEMAKAELEDEVSVFPRSPARFMPANFTNVVAACARYT
jgi:hypothetical protein